MSYFYKCSEIMYNDKQTTITREDIHSLIAHNHVLNNIVDAYTYILNMENKRRGVEKVNRFFFTTEIYVCLLTFCYNALYYVLVIEYDTQIFLPYSFSLYYAQTSTSTKMAAMKI